MSDRLRRRLKPAGILLLLWAPFAGLWIFFVRIFLEASIGEAVYSGVVAIGNAAILSVGVWIVSGRYQWPRELRPSFYLTHIALGSVYSAAWILMGHVIAQAQTGENTLRMMIATGLLGWRFIMGLWLYGLVAGVSYAVRIGRRLVEQERIAARANALAAEARLESIRSQLNPHFLFNALHTARSLVPHDPELARDTIEKLGGLLRYSLDRSSSSAVPLSDEWDFTERYLSLERLRLGERLTVEAHFDTGVEDCPVPPFVIQPLVENAILHGVAPCVAGGTVKVSVRQGNGRLAIEVEDDGMGADPGEVKEGRGHRLLKQRLDALYGGDASVETSGEKGSGFRVLVQLPIREEDPRPEGDRDPTFSGE